MIWCWPTEVLTWIMAGLFNLLGVDGGVLAILPTVDVAGVGVVGVSDLVGLDLSGLEAALIYCAFDLEALSFFAELGLGNLRRSG